MKTSGRHLLFSRIGRLLLVFFLITILGYLYHLESKTRLVRSSDPLSFDISSLSEQEGGPPDGLEVLRGIKEDWPQTFPVSRIVCALRPEAAEQRNNETKKTERNNLVVPNVVHYVFLGSDLNFTFINHLSYLSVERFIQPDAIFIHGDDLPSGKWWNLTINTVRNIYHVQRPYVNQSSNGVQMKFPAHASDYIRAEILIRYGGIYLDADVLAVKSFEPLRKFPMTIGRETETGLCNGIMIARPGAPFARLILEQYRSYAGKSESWAGKSVYNLHTLASLYPHMVHIEESSLNRPNWKEVAAIYSGLHNLERNYAIHLWMRLWPKDRRPNGPKDLPEKTTVGLLYRQITTKRSDRHCL